MTTPPWRWFRFSLRTPFVVVTAICVWLGWQASIVRHRRAMRAELEASGWQFSLAGEGPLVFSCFIFGQRDSPHGQFIRRLMGDPEYAAIFVPPKASKELRAKARAAFPSELMWTDN